MSEYLGSQLSLQDLEHCIAEREARMGERERMTSEISALAAFVQTSAEELTRATERFAQEVSGRALSVRALASLAQRPAAKEHTSGTSPWALQESLVSGRSYLCAEALKDWVKADEKLAKAVSRLCELRRQLAMMPDGPDPVLQQLRQWRDAMRAQAESRRRQTSSRDPDPGIDRAMIIKLKNGKIEEHDRFDWSDLPEYLGDSLAGGSDGDRMCPNCGSTVPRGRKRFCCRTCHLAYLELYGTPAMPKSAGDAGQE